MKRVKVLVDGRAVFREYTEISTGDVWRMHRRKELPEFLPTAWIRDGRSNPLLARLRVVYLEIFYWLTATLGLAGSFLPIVPCLNKFTPILVSIGISMATLALWFAYNREHRLAESCSRVYAEHVCWLFNSLSRSQARQDESSPIPGDGFDDQSVKVIVESWLVNLLVIVHKNENPPADFGVDKKLAMLKKAADKMMEFRKIASAGQAFGLVDLSLTRYHKLADEQIEEDKKLAKESLSQAASKT